jgi:hypothetical protein
MNVWTAVILGALLVEYALEVASHACGPATASSQRIAARRPPPRSAARTRPLARSIQNVRGDVRLNPKCASITNVDHQRSGIDTIPWPSTRLPTNTRPLGIAPRPRPRTAVSSQWKPPANQKASSSARSTVRRTRPKRVRTRAYRCASR